nr:hypothetical protein [Tanacetum cinerariifolium]
MSLEEFDDLNILDATPVVSALEACSLPKFGMHMYKSSLAKSYVIYLVKLYGILEDLHTQTTLSVLYVTGLSNVWKHTDRDFSLKDSEGKVITMVEFLRLPNFKGCKVSVGALLPPGTTRVAHLASLVERLEDIPPKTGDMMTAEIPCRKVYKVATKREAGGEGGRKRKVHVGAPVQRDSEHVSSPTPLNHALPLETLANTKHVSPNLSAGRMGENVVAFVNEGHGDNEGRISGLQTQPSPLRPADLFETLEKPACDKVVPEAKASYSAGRFGALNLEKSLEDRVEELEEEIKNSEHLNSVQAGRIKQLEEVLKQSEDDAHQLRLEREKFAVEARNEEVVRCIIINQYLPTFVREVFSLAVGKGFIDGISIGRKEPDIQAFLKATPNVDLASSDTFMDAYAGFFDRRYPYVEKVARMYLLDPSGLQNIMPDETGPTLGGGPCDTPTASYA